MNMDATGNPEEAVPSFASQVFRLASEAARLARMLSPPHDVLADVLRELEAAQLAVTHCGHAALNAANIGFSGPEGFEVEDAIVRVTDAGLAIEPDRDFRWFAMFMNLPKDRDAIVTVDVTTDPASTLTAFIRCRAVDGSDADGPRVRLGSGHVVADHYIHRPDFAGMEEVSSQLFITIDLFSGATIGALGVATAPSAT